MGVDIYGRNPQIKSEKPQIEWETSSSDDKSKYIKAYNDWEDENPGYYFRSNWWGWRPIVAMVETASIIHNVDVDTNKWQHNDGEGPETQEECDAIANLLEHMMNASDSPLKEDDDVLYTCIGSWCTSEGQFLTQEEQDQLNEEYPIGTTLTGSIILSNGKMVVPSHGTSYRRIKEFINFLRNCGGFQIY